MDAAEFLKKIKPNDNVVIIFNNDGDGICSCAMIKILLNKFTKIEKEPFIIPQPMPMDKNLIQRIQTTVPTKILFLDLAADQQQNIIKKMVSISDILIIDHHQITKNLNSMAIVHHNPRIKSRLLRQSACQQIRKPLFGQGQVNYFNLFESLMMCVITEKFLKCFTTWNA